MSLRRAALSDLEWVWELVFCSELRDRMAPQRGLVFGGYERWFRTRLDDRQTPMWLVRAAGARAGVALVDRHDKQSLPHVALVVGLRWRNQGVGRAALAALCEQWQHPLLADTFTDRPAAVRVLEAAGFSRASEKAAGDRVMVTYLWSP